MEPARPAAVERRLPAILAADVAEYSRLIGADEEGTLGRLRALCPRARLILTSKSSAAASSKPRATAGSSGPPASSTQWEYFADGMNL
jgi:hypothetical protein